MPFLPQCEAFEFQKDGEVGNKKIYQTLEDTADTYPYLLVNIGSGVSIICIKVGKEMVNYTEKL